jgi:DNA-binding NarL/FixJ family response regulator
MKPSNTVSVAIADDSTLYRTMLQCILTKAGIEVIYEANNGYELLNQVEYSGRKPDICILDTNMPVMDGYATAYALRMQYPEMAIIGHSFFSEKSRLSMFACGAFECVSKDSEPDVLIQAIRNLALMQVL